MEKEEEKGEEEQMSRRAPKPLQLEKCDKWKGLSKMGIFSGITC